MKALIILFCLVAVVRAEDSNLGTLTGTLTISTELIIVPQSYYSYEPQKDITAYDLAVILPYFSSYGMGKWSSPQSAVVPIADSRKGGMPIGGTILMLDDFDKEKLGEAIRHLRKLNVEEEK